MLYFREELAVIENRILEKELVAKKKAEKRAKNIAVCYLAKWVKKRFIKQSVNFANAKACHSWWLGRGRSVIIGTPQKPQV